MSLFVTCDTRTVGGTEVKLHLDSGEEHYIKMHKKMQDRVKLSSLIQQSSIK